MKADRQLVILTTHFGTNFSGGSTATCELFSRIQHEFERIVVVGTELGKHPFEKLEFQRYRNWFHATRLLKGLRSDTTLFYGDFYNAFLFGRARLPFYFTYHDNWPEMAALSFKSRLKSLFYTRAYRYVFKKARFVFLVSESKQGFVKPFTDRFEVVKNGFTRHDKVPSEDSSPKVLMVGSIDQRKYELSLKLFKRLPADFNTPIHIYGHIKNQKIANELKQYAFVSLMGFHEQVNYSHYSLLLHTSFMENLPLVFCEALDQDVPVLAFDVGGSSEIVTEDNGRLIPAYDLGQMQTVLLGMLSKKLVFSLDKAILQEHSWEKSANRYRQILLGK